MNCTYFADGIPHGNKVHNRPPLAAQPDALLPTRVQDGVRSRARRLPRAYLLTEFQALLAGRLPEEALERSVPVLALKVLCDGVGGVLDKPGDQRML